MPVGNVDVDAFWKNGYTIIRNVYTAAQIEEFRASANASQNQGVGDLLSNPRMRRALTDGTMVEIARQILGSDDIWYSGDSTYTINSGQRGFHKDNTDRNDVNAPDWQTDRYTVLRFGIYLQDHTRHSGGLNLRSGSHDVAANNVGENIYVRTGVGDVAVWSLRTTHSGNGALLRWPPNATVEPRMVKKLPKWKAKGVGTEQRMAIFAALGLNDAHHDRYVDYLKTRRYMVDIFRKSIYDAETLAEAEKAGLHVRDVRTEIQGDDTVGKNEKWEPFPYPGMKETTIA